MQANAGRKCDFFFFFLVTWDLRDVLMVWLLMDFPGNKTKGISNTWNE